LKVVTEEAVGMSDGKLFHAVGLATQNARSYCMQQHYRQKSVQIVQ